MHRVNDAGGVLESLGDCQTFKVNFLNFRSRIILSLPGGGATIAKSGTGWIQRPQLGLALQPRREDQGAAKGSKNS